MVANKINVLATLENLTWEVDREAIWSQVVLGNVTASETENQCVIVRE
jgi:hypothetical protein